MNATATFAAACRPLLLGSMPGDDHFEAVETILRTTPEIPTWPQLPANPKETILQQFLPGLPGTLDGQSQIVTSHAGFADEVSLFLQEYKAVKKGRCSQELSRFTMKPEEARGFFTLLAHLRRKQTEILAVKGQMIGPITFCTSIRDETGTPVFANRTLRDCAVKLIGMKARWQLEQLTQYSATPILFFDEPMLFGMGHPSFPHMKGRTILEIYGEIMDMIASQNGLTGIHVCADTDWGLLFNTGVNIISFDAYNYFDHLLSFPEQLKGFMARGGILAFGIVPTAADTLIKESCNSLAEKWDSQVHAIEQLGIERQMVHNQSLITPSCGTGRLTHEQSSAVLHMTRELSILIREKYHGPLHH